jgi:hypothetical protein
MNGCDERLLEWKRQFSVLSMGVKFYIMFL